MVSIKQHTRGERLSDSTLMMLNDGLSQPFITCFVKEGDALLVQPVAHGSASQTYQVSW
jgi:hypothetical protein